MSTKEHTTSVPVFNRQNPATWLKPDEPLIGADGRDWSWCYVWHRDIEGFPCYKVGVDGSVWSKKTNPVGRFRREAESDTWKRLKPCRFGKTDHRQVTLCLGREKHYRRIHRLVLEAFVGPCPPGMEGCHFPDRDATNNCLFNLRWGTNKDNKDDMVIHGTRLSGERHPMAQISDAEIRLIREDRNGGMLVNDIAEKHGISVSHVGLVTNGRLRKDAGGPIQTKRRAEYAEHGPDDPPEGVEYRDIPEFPGYKLGSDESLWTCRTNAGRISDRWKRLKILCRGRAQRLACLYNGRTKQVPMWKLKEAIFGIPS